jgi:lipopolysaccharide/colanic/teichoic acid biosynthesis glycosyltransferase
VLLPFLILIGILVTLGSPGGPFYRQVRVGKEGKHFKLLKFRSMRPGSDQHSQITIGENDSRITGVGKFIRKYKLDELPQLINIILGDMSIVGPRPEVPKYVDQYTPEQKAVLKVKPGLTDYASLKFFNENELLAQSPDPHKTYSEVILPEKLRLNLEYIENQSLLVDLEIIGKTIARIISG